MIEYASMGEFCRSEASVASAASGCQEKRRSEGTSPIVTSTWSRRGFALVEGYGNEIGPVGVGRRVRIATSNREAS
jgi:hypothetical protein